MRNCSCESPAEIVSSPDGFAYTPAGIGCRSSPQLRKATSSEHPAQTVLIESNALMDTVPMHLSDPRCREAHPCFDRWDVVRPLSNVHDDLVARHVPHQHGMADRRPEEVCHDVHGRVEETSTGSAASSTRLRRRRAKSAREPGRSCTTSSPTR